MTTSTSQATERLYFLDWLRILAFAALVVYHVGMYYVSWDFHVKSPFAGPGLEPWLLSCGVLTLWPAALQVTARLVNLAFRGLGIILVPVALILLLRLTLFERYPATHALWGDWFNHAIYFGMFILGALFATPSTQWQRLASLRWPALVVAFSYWAVLVFVHPSKPMEHAVVAVYQRSALVAAFGFARTHLNRDSPLRSRLTEAVFPVYLLHQTIIIVGSQLLLSLRLPPAIEGPILVLAAFAFSYAGYELVRHVNALRPWFGLKTVNCQKVRNGCRRAQS